MGSNGGILQPRLKVVMLPWVAFGHISPFLELAVALSRHNVAVHLCSSPANLRSITSSQSLINLVELHLPGDLLPPHLHTTKNLPPHLMPALKTVVDAGSAAFGRLLDEISPDLIIYDFVVPWAATVAGERNIPAVLFFANAAATTTLFCHHLKRPAVEAPFPALRFEGQNEKDVSVKMLWRRGNGKSDGERYLEAIEGSSGFVAFRSFREIEGKYFDYLPSLLGKEALPVGALISSVGGDRDSWQDQDKLVEWLNKKPAALVVFVSLGSEYFITNEEMMEIARGLELSKFSFIWVVRFPINARVREDGQEVMDSQPMSATSLPAGLMERLHFDRKGIVVEGWAPQKRILSHPSIGGFLTHCGWSSINEGMRLGVPMIALPLQIDQPVNASIVVNLGVALRVMTTSIFDEGLKECVNKFKGEDMARCIEEVMVGKGGESVRKRAKEMAELMANKGDEEIEMFVAKIEGLVREIGLATGSK
ncbi:Flavanone 7-O-glucoside 2''-O-beta-L-rhamnosyltransferase [Platanthera guangdongensis]|uniref:Glycosyltransferase n=1 Tax=Platanthera guangdongensis TaxID=2320717 RepID=A0ABR2MC00_9ASPA